MRRALVVTAMVVVVDGMAKAVMPREGWSFHEAHGFPWRMIVCCAALAAVTLATGWVGPAVALGGAVGNTVWALTGGCPNPFVIPVPDGLFAFNVADVALLVGAILTCAAWTVTLLRCGSWRCSWSAVRANGAARR